MAKKNNNTLHLKMPDDLLRQLKKLAKEEDRNQHNMCIRLISEAISKRAEA